jgi:hypothetical protein
MVRVEMLSSESALVTPWQIGRGWPADDLQAELTRLTERPLSYPVDTVDAAREPGWTVEHFVEILAQEPPGPPLPDGCYTRACAGVAGYRFAHPGLTEGHFDPYTPLLGRNLLILIRVIFVRLLVGLRIGAVRNETTDTETRFGVRMDTLAGHILHGSEWVQVVKDHRSGGITMQLDVQWRPAQLPTWWMALGFRLFGRQFQQRWRRLAVRRLRYLGAGMEARAICGSEGTPA